jgi:hypothetical protein
LDPASTATLQHLSTTAAAAAAGGCLDLASTASIKRSQRLLLLLLHLMACILMYLHLQLSHPSLLVTCSPLLLLLLVLLPWLGECQLVLKSGPAS